MASEPAAAGAADGIVNAFSIDVEDYFHVAAFDGVVRRADWDRLEPRVERSTRRLLELLARHGVRATCFVLGWVGERFPELVREIHAGGHELAVHGYDHRSITTLSRDEFRADVRRTKELLEELAGAPVIGYRAPNFSIVKATLWAADVLLEEGFRYDSSIFPVRHDRYGIPDAPRFPWRLRDSAAGTLHEFPPSTVRFAALNLPFAGGGYLRQLPFALTRWCLRHVNRAEGRPGLLYVHPWEVDPEQPRQPVGLLTRIRHYRNLDRTEPRLERLLAEFRFAPVREVLGL